MFQHPPALFIGGKCKSGLLVPPVGDHQEFAIDIRMKNRCLLVIHNSQPLGGGGSSSSLNSLGEHQVQQKAAVSFTALSFSRHMPKFAAVDQKGVVVIFDLQSNKFVSVSADL